MSFLFVKEYVDRSVNDLLKEIDQNKKANEEAISKIYKRILELETEIKNLYFRLSGEGL